MKADPDLDMLVQAPESSAAQNAPEVKAEQEASTSAAAVAAPSAAAASSANAPASSAAPKTLIPIGERFDLLRWWHQLSK
jgi:hypothetical protein